MSMNGRESNSLRLGAYRPGPESFDPLSLPTESNIVMPDSMSPPWQSFFVLIVFPMIPYG